MKSVGGIIGAVTGLWVAVWSLMVVWSDWITPLIPANEWAGLIKLTLALILIFFGGGIVVIFVALVTALFTFVFASIMPGK